MEEVGNLDTRSRLLKDIDLLKDKLINSIEKSKDLQSYEVQYASRLLDKALIDYNNSLVEEVDKH